MLKFLLPGNWSSAQVTVAWMKSSRRLEPIVETAIEAAWQTALDRPGIHLFDGPMARLESWAQTNDGVQLNLSESSYKIFLGTNMANPAFAARFGSEVMGNPLGVSTVLLTTDGQMLLGRRSAAVAYHPNRVHPFAGCMEPGDRDPFTTASRELAEELSLTHDELLDLRCTGLVEDQELRQPELTFIGSANLTREQIKSRLDPAEHRSLWSIPAEPSAIELAADEPSLTPVAMGALLLWGRIQWGQPWFEEAQRRKIATTRLSSPKSDADR